MANTIGWTDGMDGVDIVIELEHLFGIKFTAAEAERAQNVGELYDLLARKIPVDETKQKCATAMAFYRLRRAIADIRDEKKLNPSAPLVLSNRLEVWRFLHRLEKATGFELPRHSGTILSRVAAKLVMLAGCLFVVAAIIAIGGKDQVSFWWFVAPACTVVLGIFTFLADEYRVPENCETLSGLAKRVAAKNHNKLVAMGAHRTPDGLWDFLVELLAARGRLPWDQITRETMFYKGQQMRAV